MIDLELFSQTFPPRWKVGDTWVVSAKTEDVLRSRPGRDAFETNEFRFEVAGLPGEGTELARIVVRDHVRRGNEEAYELTFRPKPFSLAEYRVLDRRTGAIQHVQAKNGPSPFLGHRSSGLIVDFPVHPPEHALADPLPFTFELHRRGVQMVEVTPEGLRFIVTVGTERCTFEWKRGEPWWSTFRRVLFLEEAGEFDVDSAHLVREPAGR